MELGQLVSPLIINPNKVLAVTFIALPAESEVPLLLLMEEGLRGVLEGCRVFASDNVSPSVDLYRCSPTLPIRSDH